MVSILIAEDESRIAAFIEKGLQKQGYETQVATDGREVLSLLESEHFDLMLLDIGLPILDGWQILAQLQKQHKSIPIIVVTARDDVQEKVTEFPSLVSGCLSKPFRFNHLIAIVSQCLL